MRISIALAVCFVLWSVFTGREGTALTPTQSTMTAALRLHEAPEDDTPVGFTMREAYGKHLAPSLVGRSRKTVTQFTTAISLWEQFCGLGGITTSNPAQLQPPKSYPVDQIGRITDSMLDEFARWLMAEIPTRNPTKYKRSTVETYGKKIRGILKILGPREAGNKRGANILEFVPSMSAVGDLAEDSADDDESIDLQDDQISRIYQACDIADWPSDFAPLQWRTYVVILAMLGPRVNDGAVMAPANFRLDPKSPIKHSQRKHDLGWLDYVQEKTGKRVIVPLPPVVRTHIDAMLRAQAGHRLFDWHSSRSAAFAAQWQRIVDQAGLDEIQRKHFRPTANFRWTIAANDREVGAMVLGHAAADVNSKHYTRNEAILIEHVNNVAAPEAFLVDPTDQPTQLFLF